jgi:hypothetical protein
MTLGNMRGLGVTHLIAYCHNDNVEVPSFQRPRPLRQAR